MKSARLAAFGFALALVVVAPTANASDQEPAFTGAIEVRRALVDVRVMHGGGIVRDLAVADFRVSLDGRPATVESVEWVAGSEPPEAVAMRGTAQEEPAPRRLVVFFFQNDMHRTRIGGLFRMAPRAVELLDSLHADDLVAVVSHDSHLRLLLDFTNDRERLRKMLTPKALLGRGGGRPSTQGPSLFARLPERAARRAYTPERGLLLVGQALKHLPGSKSLAFFGWGLGELHGRAGVSMRRDYGPALAELRAGRVTVFSLDVTDADYHSLEVGLQQVAEDTGGFYARTHLFPGLAAARLEAALEGRYVLVVILPEELPRGRHRLEVTVPGRGADVLYPAVLLDEPDGSPPTADKP